MKHFVLAYTLMLFTTQAVNAQRACASHEYLQQQLQANPLLAQKIAEIDAWKGSDIALNGSEGGSTADPLVIKIPVVVHVLYNSTATNISDAQIQSQIDVLNRDYRKLNADTINTPAAFKNLAADCRIQFELAKIDPDGRATTGIVRKFSSIQMFGLDDRIKHSSIGGHDAWDANNYLNIWVGVLAANLLGYASTLGCAKDVDGVVITPNAFGTVGSVNGGVYNKGRTATHEIGHWLGLRHIWGDAYCGNDYIDDTPPQRSSSRSCPTGIVVSCDNNPTAGNMYSNYMDFTDDACLNLFTIGQRDKMRALFIPGGARYSLLFSKGVTGTPIVDPVKPAEEPVVEQPALVARAYPNPAYSTVTIDAGTQENIGRMISVHNHLGQQVMTATLSKQVMQLNIRSLTSGVYYIRIGGDKRTLKIVKTID
jgi:hypothetical protein